MPIESHRYVYLAPHEDCHLALLNAAKAAKRSLHALIYSLTLDDLAQVFIEKLAAGLDVGLVCDKSQSSGPAEHALLQKLVDAGVPVTIGTSTTGAIDHQKVLLVDVAAIGPLANDSFCVYGSYNFSASAARQDNILITDNHAALCDFLWTQYEEVEAYGKKHPTWQLKPSAQPPAAAAAAPPAGG